MKTKKFLLVLLPLLAFILVACGGLFDGEVVEEELDQDMTEDEFLIEMDEAPETIYEEETWEDKEMWEDTNPEMEDDGAVMQEEQPADPEMMY